MKKFVALILGVLSCFVFFACSSDYTFVALNDNQTLVVGNSKYYNTTEEVTTTDSYTYIVETTFTLRRSSYRYDDYVEYNGYYYYWDTEDVTATATLGKSTLKNTTKYYYLTYGADKENIRVKKVTETSKSYDYQGGFRTHNRTINYNLNGYFDSISNLEIVCPELLAKIDNVETKKYYVDTTTPNRISTNYYGGSDTYYYFE